MVAIKRRRDRRLVNQNNDKIARVSVELGLQPVELLGANHPLRLGVNAKAGVNRDQPYARLRSHAEISQSRRSGFKEELLAAPVKKVVPIEAIALRTSRRNVIEVVIADAAVVRNAQLTDDALKSLEASGIGFIN